MGASDTYYFVATCIASAFGFGFAWTLNRFVNRMDKKMDKFDELIVSIQERYNQLFRDMQEEISDLKSMVKLHDSEIKNLQNRKK